MASRGARRAGFMTADRITGGGGFWGAASSPYVRIRPLVTDDPPLPDSPRLDLERTDRLGGLPDASVRPVRP